MIIKEELRNREVEEKASIYKTLKLKKNRKIPYSYLKVKPDVTIGLEQKTYLLAKAIHSILQIKLNCVVEADDGHLYKIPENEIKISYIIDLGEKVNFYFVCPTSVKDMLIEKVYEVFKNCVITEIKELDILDKVKPQMKVIKPKSKDIEPKDKPKIKISKENLSLNKIKSKLKTKVKDIPKREILNKDIEVNSLELKYNDAISLNMDNKLYTLEEMVMNHYWLTEDDRVSIVFNFSKSPNKEFLGAKQECLRRVRNDEPTVNFLNNKVNVEYIAQKSSLLISDALAGILDVSTSMFAGKMNDRIESFSKSRKPNPLEQVSLYTREKLSQQILKTEILVLSKSKDIKRRKMNLKNICDTFTALDDDNELLARKVRCPMDFENINLGGRKNLLSLLEISKFLILPNNQLLNENDNIDQIKTRQNKVADYFKTGNFYLGENTFRSETSNLYLPKDYDSESLAYCLIAPQGAGKTTLLTNLAVNSYVAGQANVFVDYIKNCEAANEIEKHIDKKDLIIINAEDVSTLPLIDFNEYDISKAKSEEEIGKAISAKIDATESIINTINEEQILTANMSEILSQCCQIVYSYPKTNMGNVIDFIINHEYRLEMMEKVSKIKYKDVVLNKKLNEALEKVATLNEYGKGEDSDIVVGTISSKINGILSRISQIKKSYLLYNMFYNPKCKTLNFVDLIEAKKTILVKLPEHSVTPSEKNVITTFITMKTILSIKKRGGMYKQPPRSNLWIDEVYQVKTVENVIHAHLSQLRKYGLKVILTLHRMSQLNNKKFKDELFSSGASFSLLRGCKEIQVKDFLDRLNNFTEEDIYNLETFHAFHIINSNKNGEWQGITSLPKPL